MSINEVFPNPTVKQVIFQIRYPSLFYLEKGIGDFQVLILKEFPDSSEIFRQQLIFTDIRAEQRSLELTSDKKPEITQKVWQFKSEKGVVVNVSKDSLSISSTHHKTYRNDAADKFRDQIQFIVDSFMSIIQLPIISRIGLRYIDECPIPEMKNRAFSEWYSTTFPIDRFDLETAIEMDFKCVVQRGELFIRFIESLKIGDDNNHNLILDFDGYKNTVEPTDYLSITDSLHTIIIDEYKKSINDPVYNYMRGK